MAARTIKLPGMQVPGTYVDPVLASFTNDLVYMTFYAESGQEGIYRGQVKLVNDDMKERKMKNTRYLGPGMSPDDVISLMRSNIDVLLRASPYSGGVIKSASVELLLVESTSRGNIVSYKVNVQSDRQLITATYAGAVQYEVVTASI